MLKRLHRWFATPAGVVTVAVTAIAWTWLTLGWEVAWRLLVVLMALGVADILLGAFSKPLSLEVYWGYKRNRFRYYLWAIGVLFIILLLHLHFTGLG